jgi:hypothetical protein
MEHDPLERTIVMKVTKKTHGNGIAPGPRLLKREAAPKSPEETEKALAALASLYRLFRG